MSSSDRHRGKHPSDTELFGPAPTPALRQAVSDLSWLLGRGYARNSAVKLVGDRYELRERQRLAAARAACSDTAREARAQNHLPAEALRGRSVWIDGFNLLVTLEAALSGGVLLHCRDGCLRDMSSVHGSYHAVVETDTAITLVGSRLAELHAASVHWLLDKPVSNSGRLAARIRELTKQHTWPWTVEAVFNPDTDLIAARDSIIISSDAVVIDGAASWYNLASDLILTHPCGPTWIVDLHD
ncbi:DUF434 domain-containing protein [Prosthecobacter sp.]|uniref:DUF434 domain-containing protein n=1 Tax=Prosthecobacter sp. TaxID=1965333 RepID=UPI003783015F